MSARDDVSRCAGMYDTPAWSAVLDAYRDEVLREAAERIRGALLMECAPGCEQDEQPHYRCGCSCDENHIVRRAADLIDPDKDND